eukprot:712535-Amphidinium_carterae.1
MLPVFHHTHGLHEYTVRDVRTGSHAAMAACENCGGYAYRHVKTLARPCPGPLPKNAAQRRRLGRNQFPQGGAQGMHYRIEWANAITGREVRISMREDRDGP